MPSAQDVYITPASSKIQIYSGSAMNGLISGNTHLYVSGSSDLLLKAADDIYLSTYGSSGIIVFETDSAESGRWLEDKGLRITQGTPGTTTDALYNVGGSLYFNGSEVGGGGGGTIGGTVSAGYIPYASSGDTLANALLFTSGATESMYIGATPGTLNAANYNTTLGYQAGDDMTEGDENTLIGQAAGANITTGDANTMIGRNAGHALTTTSNNTFVGSQAGQNVAASYNTIVGAIAGYNTGGALGDFNNFFGFGAGQNIQGAAQKNVAIGVYALYGNTSNTSATANNVAIGHETMKEIEGGYQNIGIGSEALLETTSGYRNVAVGFQAGKSNTTGVGNSFFGYQAGYGKTGGTYNTIMGYNAFTGSTDADENVAIGSQAMRDNTSGDYNTAVGTNALYKNTTAGLSTAIGYRAMFVSTTAAQNVSIGAYTLYALTDGDNNVAIGYKSGYDMTTGTENVLVGPESGENMTDGGYNVAIGSDALKTSTSASYSIAIGKNAMSSGDVSANKHTIGIGYNAMANASTSAETVMIGSYAGDAVTTGGDNTGIGHSALSTIAGGAGNTAVGREAMRDIAAGSNYNTGIGTGVFGYGGGTQTGNVGAGWGAGYYPTGNYNVFMGFKAGYGNVSTKSAHNNVAIGSEALFSITSGDDNVAVGYQAAYDTTTGYENIYIGKKAGENVTTANRSIYIGSGAGAGNVASAEFGVYIGQNAGGTAVSGMRNTIVGGGAGANGYAAMNETTLVGYAAGVGVSGANNTFIGASAGNATNAAINCVAVGTALRSITGSSNVAVGYGAMADGAGSAASSVAVGARALQAVTTGVGNTAIGKGALQINTTQSYNTTVGDQAGYKVNTASNTIMGARAGEKLAGGSGFNTHIGAWSGRGDSDTYSGSYNTTVGAYTMGDTGLADANYNTIVGFEAGKAITGGDNNTLIGVHAGNDLTTGEKNTVLGTWAFASGTSSYNTILGYSAGNAITSGEENTIIGYNAGDALTTTNYNVFIGNGAAEYATTVGNSVVIGRQAMGAAAATGDDNVIIGYRAAYDLTTAHSNIFVGKFAGQNVTSDCREAVVIGFQALDAYTTNSSHGRFTLVGGYAGKNISSTSSDKNNYTGIGYMAGYNDKSDAQHQLFGSSAGYNLSGSSGEDGCTFVGSHSGYGDALGFIGNDTTGIGRGVFSDDARYSLREVFIGSRAGANYVSGSYNVVIGYDAMRYGGQASLGATENTIVGREAGYNLGRHAAATGSVAIGKGAGTNVSGGSKNVYIGYEAGPSSATATESNKLYINNASGTPLIEGDFGGILTFNVTGNAPNSLTVTADQSTADGILVDSYEPRIVLKNRRSSGNDSVAIRYDNATPSLQIRTSRDSYAVPMAMFNDDGATFGINAGAWGAGVSIASGASYSLDNTTTNRITRVSGKISYLSTEAHNFNNPITVTGGVRPGTDNGFDLGTAALRWSKAYLDDGFIEINADGATTDHAGAGRFWVSGTTPYFNDSVIQLGTGDPVTAASGRWTDGNSTLAPILMADYGAVANAASRAGTAAYLYWNNTTSTLHVRNINVGSVAALPADTTATTQSSGDNSTKVATTAYADAAGGGGGISWDGSTANGVATYKDADEATVESNLTFDGTDLLIGGTGKLKLSGSNNYIYASGDDTRVHATDTVVLDGDGKCMFRTPYLALETSAASEKFRFDIDNTKFGIGTNAPGENLHVVGTSRVTGKAAFGSSTLSTGDGISVSNTIQVAERSSAPTHVDTWGVLWVKNDDPTNLYFTDDDGNDIALTDNGSAAGGGAITATANGANNRIATYSAATALNGEASLTFDGTDLINTAGTLNGSTGACFEDIDVGQVTGDVNNVSRVGPMMIFATLPSDSRLKTNRSVFDYGLNEIKQLTPEYFNYSESAYKDTTLSKPDFTKKQIGLMADDVKAVMPELVETIPDTDYETYDKQGLVNVLINAVKELSNKNDALEARVAELEGKL